MPTVTSVWIRNNRIECVGRDARAVAAVVRPHDVVTPGWSRAWEEWTERRNPWQVARNPDAVLPALSEALGFEGEESGRVLRQSVLAWSEQERLRLGREWSQEPRSALAHRELGDTAARHLAELCQRGVACRGERAPGWRRASGFAFLLSRLELAKWLVPDDEPDGPFFHGVADVGGGHMVRVVIAQLRGESMPLQAIGWSEPELWDGGDLVVQVEYQFFSAIEGPEVRPVRRRDDAQRA